MKNRKLQILESGILFAYVFQHDFLSSFRMSYFQHFRFFLLTFSFLPNPVMGRCHAMPCDDRSPIRLGARQNIPQALNLFGIAC